MSKPKHERALADHEAQAILSNVRTSPRKLNLVAAMIRNLPAQRAIATLTFSKRRIAHQVRKTLESAIANAENNHQLDVDRLVVTRAEVGRSIVMRRFHARGRGRSAQIEKWFSHMKIVVAEKREDATDDVIEGSAIRGRARRGAPVSQTTLVSPTDHVTTEAGLALPATVDNEGEAAEQAMSADAAGIADHAAAAEPHAATSGDPITDHAHTDAELSVPSTEGTEAEAAQQSMSDDAAAISDQAASDQAASDHTASDTAGEHETPPDHSGGGAT
jgi:large subunit ribosomal protein L22